MRAKRYKEVYKLSLREAKIIEDYLNASDEDEHLSEDETITHTVYFPDGCQMDIKCCGTDNGTAFAEAVLFNKNGGQMAYSEPEDEYLGTWTLKYNGTTYTVTVDVIGGGGT